MTKTAEREVTPLMQRSEVRHTQPLECLVMPEGCRMIVNFTVDYDTMLFRKYLKEPPLWMAQGEFGGRVGMWRLLALFKQYDIKATVFLPGYVGKLYPTSIQRIVDDGHELANHMWLHYVPEDPEEERQHMEKTDNLIKMFTGGFPSGTRSEHDISLLRDHQYTYYSYLPMGELPFYVFNKKLNDWILNVPFNFLYDDAMYFYFGWFGSKNQQQRIESPDVFLDVLIQSFRRLYSSTKYMNITLHPNISGRSLRILMLEKLIQEIRRHEGVFCETTRWLAAHIVRTCPPKTLTTEKE